MALTPTPWRTLSALLLLLAALLPARAQTWQWGHLVGKPAGDVGDSGVECLTADSAGNTYTLGRLVGEARLANLHATGYGLFVASLDANGQGRWISRAEVTLDVDTLSPIPGPSPLFQGGRSIVNDGRGHIYVAGLCDPMTRFGSLRLPPAADTTHEVLFVACLDAATGQWQWVTGAESANNDHSTLQLVPLGLAVGPAGEVFLSGAGRGGAWFGGWAGAVDLAPNGQAVVHFVAKCTAQGQWQWATPAPTGASPVSFGRSLLAHGGHVFVNGYLPGRMTANDSALVTTPGGANELTTFVARLDAATGTLQWVRLTGELGSSELTEPLHVDARGRLLLMGRVHDSTRFDGYLVPGTGSSIGGRYFRGRLTPRGRWQAVQPLPIPPSYIAPTPQGTGYRSEPNTATFTRSGELLVAGFFNDSAIQIGPYPLRNARRQPSPFPSYDVFVASFDSLGTCIRAVQAGGEDNDFPISIAQGAPGQFYCASDLLGDSTTYGPVAVGTAPGIWVSQSLVARLDGLLPAPTGTPALAAGGGAFRLYPNPAHHAVRLTNAPGATAQVVDALGRTVRTAPLAPGTAPLLDLQGLAPGLYVVRCGTATRRLVVE